MNYSDCEYVLIEDGPIITTNEVESFFALVKRAHCGTHHHYSTEHMGRYIDERCFMWNGRFKADRERIVEAIEGAEGKRLMFREPA